MTPSAPAKFMLLALAGTCLLSLAGCGEKTRARDFNELIPRLMSPVKHYNNPTEAAANMFNTTSPDERRDAVAYLEKQKYGNDPVYMRAYKLLTTDPSPMVRAQAMRALGSSRDPAILPWLVDGTTGKTGMADQDAEVRLDACQCFLHVFSEPTVPIVIAHLKNDPDDQVRIACARCLRNTRSTDALLALIEALNDKNAAVVYWAHETLMDNTGNSFDFDSGTWLTWYRQAYNQTTTRPSAG